MNVPCPSCGCLWKIGGAFDNRQSEGGHGKSMQTAILCPECPAVSSLHAALNARDEAARGTAEAMQAGG